MNVQNTVLKICWFLVQPIKIELLYDSILLETTKRLQYFRHHADYESIIRYIIGLVKHVQFDGFTTVNFITYFSWFIQFDNQLFFYGIAYCVSEFLITVCIFAWSLAIFSYYFARRFFLN